MQITRNPSQSLDSIEDLELEAETLEKGFQKTNFGSTTLSTLEGAIAQNFSGIHKELKRQARPFEKAIGYVIGIFGCDTDQYWIRKKSKRLQKQAVQLEDNIKQLREQAERHLRDETLLYRQHEVLHQDAERVVSYCQAAQDKIKDIESSGMDKNEAKKRIREASHSAAIVNIEHSSRTAGKLAYIQGKIAMLEKRGRQLSQICLQAINDYAQLENQRAFHECSPYLKGLPQTVSMLRGAAEQLEHLNSNKIMARLEEEQEALLDTFTGNNSFTEPPRYIKQALAR